MYCPSVSVAFRRITKMRLVITRAFHESLEWLDDSSYQNFERVRWLDDSSHQNFERVIKILNESDDSMTQVIKITHESSKFNTSQVIQWFSQGLSNHDSGTFESCFNDSRVMTRESPSHDLWVIESWLVSHRVMTRESLSHDSWVTESWLVSHRVMTRESPCHDSRVIETWFESPWVMTRESPSHDSWVIESSKFVNESDDSMTRWLESSKFWTSQMTRWLESLNFWRVMSDSMTRVQEFVTYEEPWLLRESHCVYLFMQEIFLHLNISDSVLLHVLV